MRYAIPDADSTIQPVQKPLCQVSVQRRLIQDEELLRDVYVYRKLKKLGYDSLNYDDRKYSGYDEKEYFRCVEIATNCLENGVPIPEDVRSYMLKVKAIKEKCNTSDDSH